MYPAIISVGPGAGKSNNSITNTMEKVWVKYQQFIYAFVLDPNSSTYNYPSNLAKSEIAIIWAEVDDNNTNKFRVFQKETKDFSFENLDRITNLFLRRYNPGSLPNPSADPRKEATGGKTGSEGIDEGNKPDARNDATGKGGNFGFSSSGGQINLPNLPWFWLACAGFGALWFFSTDEKKVVIRLTAGSITVLCTAQYLQKAKLPFKIPFIGQSGLLAKK